MKIFIQPARDKFIDNCIPIRNSNFTIESQSINKNIYKIHHHQKCSHYIFVDKLLDNELLQFINDNYKSLKIYIYHLQTINDHLIQSLGNKVNHILELPALYNPEIYYNTNKPKEYQIVGFLDNTTSIPERLNQYLYPNSKLPIRLFNHPGFKHPQNLGLLLEENKAEILNKSEHCLILNKNDYVIESKLCNCTPLDISELSTLKAEIYSSFTSDKAQTYEDFILEKIL